MEEIKYDLYKNPSKSSEYQSSQYHIRIKDRQVIDLNSLSDSIREKCSMTRSDVNGVLTALQDEIISHLSSGNIVKLDNVCQFEIILGMGNNSKAENGNSRDITMKAIKIRPENYLKEKVRNELLKKKKVRSKGLHSENMDNDEIRQKLDSYFAKDEFITRSSLEKLLNTTGYKARKIIKELSNEGKIENIGNKLHPIYRLVKS